LAYVLQHARAHTAALWPFFWHHLSEPVSEEIF